VVEKSHDAAIYCFASVHRFVHLVCSGYDRLAQRRCGHPADRNSGGDSAWCMVHPAGGCGSQSKVTSLAAKQFARVANEGGTMGGSLEVRQFLMRYDGVEPGNATPGTLPTQRTSGSETHRISEDQVRRARMAVASSSLGAEDCAELLDMLGLIPGDDGLPPVQR